MTILDVLHGEAHKWGPGKIHIITGEKTQCGLYVSEMAGQASREHIDQVTCIGCVKSYQAQLRNAERQKEADRRYAAFTEEKRRERVEWQAWYAEYLRSPQWQAIRLAVFSRDGWVCRGCGEGSADEVHHLTYERVGNEMLFDLITVCSNCHRRIHPDKREMEKLMLMSQGLMTL